MTETNNPGMTNPRRASHWEQNPAEAPPHKRRVMVGAIGKCVHNLGVENFSDWMKDRVINSTPVS